MIYTPLGDKKICELNINDLVYSYNHTTKETEFKKVQGNFREIDKSFKQFKIEMSGNDIMFLLDESSNV
jgi:hypothetical protein